MPSISAYFEQFCSCRFEDGVRLVKIRGESMQAAADARPSAMVSVIGLSAEKVQSPLNGYA